MFLFLVPTSYLTADAVDKIFSFIISEQLRDLAWREQVVDQDEESLLSHLSVSHQEHASNVFQTRLYI